MSHALASGMGGIRTTGDLVARMELRKNEAAGGEALRGRQARRERFDLTDSTVMRRLREELDIGVITAVPGCAKGLEAKARIADLLEIPINCVRRLEARARADV